MQSKGEVALVCWKDRHAAGAGCSMLLDWSRESDSDLAVLGGEGVCGGVSG